MTSEVCVETFFFCLNPFTRRDELFPFAQSDQKTHHTDHPGEVRQKIVVPKRETGLPVTQHLCLALSPKNLNYILRRGQNHKKQTDKRMSLFGSILYYQQTSSAQELCRRIVEHQEELRSSNCRTARILEFGCFRKFMKHGLTYLRSGGLCSIIQSFLRDDLNNCCLIVKAYGEDRVLANSGIVQYRAHFAA